MTSADGRSDDGRVGGIQPLPGLTDAAVDDFLAAVGRLKRTTQYQEAITAAEAFTWDGPVDLEEYMARMRPKPRTGIAYGKTSGLVVRLARAVAGSVEGDEEVFEAFLPEAYLVVEAMIEWLDPDGMGKDAAACAVAEMLRAEIARSEAEDKAAAEPVVTFEERAREVIEAAESDWQYNMQVRRATSMRVSAPYIAARLKEYGLLKEDDPPYPGFADVYKAEGGTP